MKPRHQVSKAAVELIKGFEGFRRASAALADGRYTIGYGHTRSARAGVVISEADAEALLIYDLMDVTKAVNELTFTPLTQNQFDALVSFALNIGVDNFRRSSVLRRVNEGNLLQAAQAIEMWRKSDFEGERIVVDALIRRRAAEKALFLTPAAGFVPAPSPVLPPRVDYEAIASGPREPAMRLITPLDGETAEAHSEGSELVAPVPDETSPVSAAAEAVAARLRALEPEEPETPEAVLEPESAVDDVEPGFALTSPEPNEGPAEAIEEAGEQAREAGADEAYLPLEDDEPNPAAPEERSELPSHPLVDDAPIVLALNNGAPRMERRDPTSYIAEETFPRFDETAEPLHFQFLPMAGLFVGGLALVAFALIWGANTAGNGGGAATVTIAWVAGLAGVAAMVSAFYLFITRLGGED